VALRPEEAALAVGISVRKLRGMGAPCVRDGNTVLYPVKALETWLNERARAVEEPGVSDRVDQIAAEVVSGLL
jgi:hypothetical protein